MVVFFLLFYRGIPAIYYGDEVGLEGGDDPDNRRAMIWEEPRWNTELRDAYKMAIKIRREVPALRRGDWRVIFSHDCSNTCAFLRRSDNDWAIIVVNNGNNNAEVSISLTDLGLPAKEMYIDKMSDTVVRSDSGELILTEFPPEQIAVFIPY
jgi:alpha-glucosidase